MANRSNFPEQIDSFAELYDLPPTMVSQAKRYQELKMKPSLSSTEQNELNGLTANLENFIITPETFNKFADALVNVETFFAQEVMGFIEAKQTLWASYVKSFEFRGEHSTSTTYSLHNMVKDQNGDLFLAIRDVAAGVAITDTAHWQKISSKGEKGDVGLNAYYKGDYSSTVSYKVGDAVSYNGLIYYCKKATTAGVAPTDATSWFLWERMVVSETAPASRQEGTVWIKITE